MYANRHAHDLVKHCRLVAATSQYLAQQQGVPENEVKHYYTAGLLHDVGKADTSFQAYIESVIAGNPCTSEFSGPYHNELSWLVVEEMAENLSGFLPNRQGARQRILNAIYWHHAKPVDANFKERGTKDAIYNALGQDITRLSPVVGLVNHLLNTEVEVEEINNGNRACPEYIAPAETGANIAKNHNPAYLAMRAVVIAADHLVSSLSLSDFDAAYADLVIDSDSTTYRIQNADFIQRLDATYSPVPFSCPDHYDAERFNIQLDCAQQSREASVVISKSPAGFGKTLQGVLRNLMGTSRTYWVCPRNAVAESVYKSILAELDALGVSSQVSVELFLTGERTAANDLGDNCPEFSSRIVVTNIDNLLAPLYKSYRTHYSYAVLTGDIIFDEYHEFVSGDAYTSLFLNTMRARSNYFRKSTTFLLSATPGLLHTTWDNTNTTRFLPSANAHYPAAHVKPYLIEFQDDFTLSSATQGISGNILVKTNSVRNARDLYQGANDEGALLFHSKFTSTDKAAITANLYRNYGKRAAEDARKPAVYSAPIISASFDLSFEQAYVMSESPENDIQVMGRVVRWGEYERGRVVFGATDSKNKSGSAAIKARYSTELSRKWYAAFKSRFEGQEVPLDAVYEFYNEFNRQYAADIRAYLAAKEAESVATFANGYYDPVRIPAFGDDDDRPKISGKNLRGTQTQHAVLVEYVGEKSWVAEPFSFSRSDTYKILDKEEKRQKKQWDTLLSAQITPAFVEAADLDFSPYVQHMAGKKNNYTMESNVVLRISRRMNAPYPVASLVYDRRLGLIAKDDLEGYE